MQTQFNIVMTGDERADLVKLLDRVSTKGLMEAGTLVRIATMVQRAPEVPKKIEK